MGAPLLAGVGQATWTDFDSSVRPTVGGPGASGTPRTLRVMSALTTRSARAASATSAGARCQDAVYRRAGSEFASEAHTWQTDVTSTSTSGPPSTTVSGSAGQRSTGTDGPTCTGTLMSTMCPSGSVSEVPSVIWM